MGRSEITYGPGYDNSGYITNSLTSHYDRYQEGTDSFRDKVGYRGKGPKNYQRADARIMEDIHDAFIYNPEIDASEVEVTVESGSVTLDGTVPVRRMKHMIEDIVESTYGVKGVRNRITLETHA